MAEYVVVQAFKDLTTGRIFAVGDEFPAVGVSETRIAELLGDVHPAHKGAIIKLVKEDVKKEVVEAPEKVATLTTDNTISEIKAYLTEHGIDFDGVTKKADLLALI